VDLQNAVDDCTVGKHVVIVFVPLAGWAGKPMHAFLQLRVSPLALLVNQHGPAPLT
jgi:hypothetical protein